MIITVFSIILAVLLEIMTPVSLTVNTFYVAPLMITGGTFILLSAVVLQTLILTPLGFLEQKLVPNLMEIIRLDRPLYYGRLILFAFPLISYASAVLVLENIRYQNWLFLVWLVFFGISLDLIRDSWERITRFLTPSYVVKKVADQAIKSVQEEEDELLWHHIDSLSEIGLQAVERNKLALGTQTLQAFPPIMHAFFDSSKSISHQNHDQEVKNETGRDEASYTIFYLLQRLELINDRALKNRLETVCRQMIMVLGKIIIYAANYDITMVSFPVHFLSKFGLKAQQHHFDEVAMLTISTLLEISKTITQDVDVTYSELKESFQAILNGLDALAKETFRKNKHMNISVLVQPFLDIKEFFSTPKMIKHRDTPFIVQEIDRIVEEYRVLDQVVNAIPPFSEIETP
ncbi:MAG: hypothetical protein Q8K60_02535 [Parachlamydiaceae bacterium]|nr:hypothetical protein [Parachlamydiaceae bacterium]